MLFDKDHCVYGIILHMMQGRFRSGLIMIIRTYHVSFLCLNGTVSNTNYTWQIVNYDVSYVL